MRNTLTKRFLSLVMALAMIVGLTAVVPEIDVAIKASAANTADSIVSIALGEVGSTNYKKYYGGNYLAWCADFVSWCAQQAGVDSITKSSSCYYMYLGMTKTNHCQVVSSPQKGDIVFFKCSYCSSDAGKWCHVGIMQDSKHSIEGNRWNSSLGTSRVEQDCTSYNHNGDLGYRHGDNNSCVERIYVRPNYSDPTPEGKEMSAGAGRTIPDGEYVITSELNHSLYLDISGSAYPAANETKVKIWNGHPGKKNKTDTWQVTYLNNGYYEITQNGTDMCLDVTGNSKKRGTKVQAYGYGGAKQQMWSISETDHGYKIQSRSTSYYLDVDGGSAEPGTAVQIWEGNDTKAQYWGFVPYANDSRPVKDGVYYIKSASGEVWLDVAGSSDFKEETKVQVWNKRTEKFRVKYMGDGFYKIIEDSSGLALDVYNGKGEYLMRGQKVQVFNTSDDTNRAQLWRIVDEGGGKYRLVSRLSGYSLDLNGGIAEKGTKVQQYTYNKTDAQKWYFISSEPLATPQVTATTLGPTAQEPIKIKLSWDKIAGASKYEVYKRIKGEEKYQLAATVTGKTYTDADVKASTVYYYRVYAMGDRPNSTAETVSANTIQPAQPKYTAAAQSTTSIKLNWNSVPNATRYVIKRKIAGGESEQVYNGTALTYLDKGLTPNTAYYYRVYAVNGSYYSEMPSWLKVMTCHQATAYAAKPATCTANGNTAYWYCSNCKKYFSDKNCTKEITKASTVIAKTGHKATAYAAKPAACTTDGNIAYWYCSNCKKYFSDKNCTKEITKASTVIAKTGHKYVTTVVPPTCTEKGYTLHKCSVCGDEYKDTETNALGHKYTSSVTKKASCTEDGTMTYTCDCGDSYTETIKSAGHKYETTTVPPTDTEAGYDEHVCSVCGDSYKDNIIPANGHSYTSEITKPASCTEDGLKTFTCTSCGDTYTEIIKATGHEYISSVIPPDCTSDGYTVHICKKCNDSYTDERIKATGHKYVDTVIAPTTTEQGCTHHKCSVCGDEYDDSFVDPIKEEAITLDIILNANDKTMSAENVSISIDGEASLTSENGKASLALADGTHEITFSAYGFVPRTYTVEVKNGKLTEELTPELNLIGDADGNGVVNTLDIVKLKRHLIKVEPLTGYALDCANTDGNDTVNTLDIVKLKRHLINVETLW